MAQVKNILTKVNFTISFVCFCFFGTHLLAQDLLVFPKRVIFEDGKRSQAINLTNTGKDTARYNISFVQIRMNEDGSFEKISQPDTDQLFADKYLRYFPHSVVLAPNESQVVKIQITKSDALQPGEYRSHLYFRAESAGEPLGDEQTDKNIDTSSISIHLTAVFGITIPTIIRIGEPTTQISVSDLSFENFNDSIPIMQMQFNRSGNMSVYGDLKVDYVSPQGKETRVADIKGIAVYTPTSKRRVRVTLEQLKGVDYSQGKLKVTYSSQAEDKFMSLAEGELIL